MLCLILLSSLLQVSAVDNKCEDALWPDTICPITFNTTLLWYNIPVYKIADCQAHCLDQPQCSHYTVFTTSQSQTPTTNTSETSQSQVFSCALLKSCNTNQTTTQTDPDITTAFSGPRSPPVKDVCCQDLTNKVCDGKVLSQDFTVKDPESCQALCVKTQGCKYFTQYGGDWCSLFTSCPKVEHCTLCTSGPANPSLETCYTKTPTATLLIGGSVSSKPYSTSIELITASSSCLPDIPEIPTGLTHHAAVLVGYTIMSCGGSSSNGYRHECHTYHLGKTGATWEVGQSMIMPRYEFSMEVYQGQVFAIGGNSDMGKSETGKTVEILKPGEGWEVSETMEMPNYRYGHCSAVLKDSLIVIGGYYGGSGYSKSVIKYDLKMKNGWKTIHSTSYGRQYHSCQVGRYMQRDGIFVTGGSNSGDTKVEFYLETIDLWRTLPLLSRNRQYHTSSILSDELYVHGGSGSGAESTQEKFNGQWTNTFNMRGRRERHACVSVPSDMLDCFEIGFANDDDGM